MIVFFSLALVIIGVVALGLALADGVQWVLVLYKCMSDYIAPNCDSDFYLQL